MGKIYFSEGLFDDLKAIQNTIHNGSDLDAIRLNDCLRKKYPIIDTMLNIADSIQARPSCGNSNTTSQSPYKAMLEQDRCGILCQTAIEKGLKQDLQSCIDHVEQ